MRVFYDGESAKAQSPNLEILLDQADPQLYLRVNTNTKNKAANKIL